LRRGGNGLENERRGDGRESGAGECDEIPTGLRRFLRRLREMR